MAKFTPTWIICTKEIGRYSCKNVQEVVLDGKIHKVNNTYRLNSGVPYLIKNETDYNEMIELDIFEDYEEPEEKAVSAPSETTKEKKLREREEAKRIENQ